MAFLHARLPARFLAVLLPSIGWYLPPPRLLWTQLRARVDNPESGADAISKPAFVGHHVLLRLNSGEPPRPVHSFFLVPVEDKNVNQPRQCCCLCGTFCLPARLLLWKRDEQNRPTGKSAPTAVGLPRAVNADVDADADTYAGIAETGFVSLSPPASIHFLVCVFFIVQPSPARFV